MTIETKFNINDLVQYKYQSEKEITSAMEVIEIQAVICYTTAQVFYSCRPIHAETSLDFDDVSKKGIRKIKNILPGILKKDGSDYMKFREDELKPCSELMFEKIKNVDAE